MSKKAKTPKTIKKREHFSFTKKFSEKELKAKQNEFQQLCVERYKKEEEVKLKTAELKNELNTIVRSASFLSGQIADGGIHEYDECEVEIDTIKMTKKYYFDGQLVGEEEADESDLQLEIEETED